MRKYPLNKQCEFCSNTFVINNGSEAPKRFCNKSCAAAAHNIKHPQIRKYPFKRACEYCGEEFDVLRTEDAAKRFCGGSCAAKHNNRLHSPESRQKQALKVTKLKTCIKCSSPFFIANQILCQPCFEQYDLIPIKRSPHDAHVYSAEHLNEMRAAAISEHNSIIHTTGLYIIYKTINLITNQYYIGFHKHIEGDNYLGSGVRLRRSMKSYGRENFIRYTLRSFPEPKEAYALEKEMVSESLGDPLCLNLAEGGVGGFRGRRKI